MGSQCQYRIQEHVTIEAQADTLEVRDVTKARAAAGCHPEALCRAVQLMRYPDLAHAGLPAAAPKAPKP